ncbi:MAG TPA: hypothetical protein VG826_05320 [Pirellulales bacterium]|nr:hypothetical protein [Pirellulales bacterium]
MAKRKQPTNQRRVSNPNEIKATGDRKTNIRTSAGGTNAPVSLGPTPLAQPKERPAPKVPKLYPSQNSPEWYPPSSGSRGSRADG